MAERDAGHVKELMMDSLRVATNFGSTDHISAYKYEAERSNG